MILILDRVIAAWVAAWDAFVEFVWPAMPVLLALQIILLLAAVAMSHV